VHFDRLMKDFDGLMYEMLDFMGVEKTPELEAEIKKVAAEQRKFQSKHKYNAQKFGISAERLRKDCAFVYETFLGGMPKEGDGKEAAPVAAPPPAEAPAAQPTTSSANGQA